MAVSVALTTTRVAKYQVCLTLTCYCFLLFALVQKLPSVKPIRGVENVPSSLVCSFGTFAGFCSLVQLSCLYGGSGTYYVITGV